MQTVVSIGKGGCTMRIFTSSILSIPVAFAIGCAHQQSSEQAANETIPPPPADASTPPPAEASAPSASAEAPKAAPGATATSQPPPVNGTCGGESVAFDTNS